MSRRTGDGQEAAQPEERRLRWKPAFNETLYFACTAAKALAENTCGGRVNDACSQVQDNLLVDCEVQSPVHLASEEVPKKKPKATKWT